MYSRCLSILYLLLANPNELNNEDEEKKLPQGTEEHPKLTKPQINYHYFHSSLFFHCCGSRVQRTSRPWDPSSPAGRFLLSPSPHFLESRDTHTQLVAAAARTTAESSSSATQSASREAESSSGAIQLTLARPNRAAMPPRAGVSGAHRGHQCRAT